MSRNKSVTTDHTATGPGESLSLAADRYNVSCNGTFVASVALERSLDSGTTWIPLGFLSTTPIAINQPVAMVLQEAESGALYRSNCTSYTSGTATVRISQ